MSLKVPPPKPSGENKRGNVRTFPDDEESSTDMARSYRGSGGYGGPEGEEENGGCRCAVRWRREARWEEIQQAIVW